MFGKSKFKSTRIDTLVGKDTIVKGDIHYAGGLHVEGRVKGNLVSEASEKTVLVVSENGYVEGDIKGPVIILNGRVDGNVYSSNNLELAKCAKINGNVYYNLLEMEVGAEVNGSLIHQSAAQTAAKTKPQTAQKPAEAAKRDTPAKPNLSVGNS